MKGELELLETDVVTGRRTNLGKLAAAALRALRSADVPFAVIGATALAVRGLPRMTRDLDVVVFFEDAFAALEGLALADFRATTPVDPRHDPEPMYVLAHARLGGDVDLLVASAEPESTVIAEAPRASTFGVEVPVATLEHLVLMYLYSNQPRHLGDLARIVTETAIDLGWVERYLLEVHPEMLPVLQERVRQARSPLPPPARPPRRRRG